MEQIIFYGSLFVALVVNAIDGLWHWLGVSPWLIVLGIIALYTFDKWSIEFAGRVQAIEKKLGIEYRPPQRKKSARWWSLLTWFVWAVYLLGKSFQAEGWVALGGMALSGFMLLLCVFCAYCFIDEAIRAYWRKKRERQEWIDKVFNKELDR
jgi:uncharacterized membrane protein YbhN (UPF0104 family)